MEEKKCCVCKAGLKKGAKKFCSNQCQQQHSWDLRKAAFEQTGVWDGVQHEFVIARHTKRYLLEVNGVCCSICGTREWMGKDVPLVLDHIDGNHANNDITNLRLVCGNCDMQLPTYKSKNKGSGRHVRRIRYASGQSY